MAWEVALGLIILVAVAIIYVGFEMSKMFW